ncbi:hypothetical protein B0H10DRAFT_2187335 [Mycena sp. CBHHK59/15]|nr:hypothetical protein B0H10DRAFT_2187335 [Mycena sp. CBHHK59/15]
MCEGVLPSATPVRREGWAESAYFPSSPCIARTKMHVAAHVARGSNSNPGGRVLLQHCASRADEVGGSALGICKCGAYCTYRTLRVTPSRRTNRGLAWWLRGGQKRLRAEMDATDARGEPMRAHAARVQAGLERKRQRRAPASCWAAATRSANIAQNVGVDSTLEPEEKSATRLEFERDNYKLRGARARIRLASPTTSFWSSERSFGFHWILHVHSGSRFQPEARV